MQRFEIARFKRQYDLTLPGTAAESAPRSDDPEEGVSSQRMSKRDPAVFDLVIKLLGCATLTHPGTCESGV
jgi:hypothetical protein